MNGLEPNQYGFLLGRILGYYPRAWIEFLVLGKVSNICLCRIQAGLSVAASDIFQLFEILEYLEEVINYIK
jgi:hypothetical protein